MNNMTLLWCIHEPLVSLLKIQLKMKCFFNNISGMGKCKWENVLHLRILKGKAQLCGYMCLFSVYSVKCRHTWQVSNHWWTATVIMMLEAVDYQFCQIDYEFELRLESQSLWMPILVTCWLRVVLAGVQSEQTYFPGRNTQALLERVLQCGYMLLQVG